MIKSSKEVEKSDYSPVAAVIACRKHLWTLVSKIQYDAEWAFLSVITLDCARTYGWTTHDG
eukprot:snap_masked-scaffold_1-processed-gene-23.43-mRNA-1 protein AED:1.00 eAED:1.00 QI:0/0/0/0/1/1/2/0/60